jgi:hypothetical protein
MARVFRVTVVVLVRIDGSGVMVLGATFDDVADGTVTSAGTGFDGAAAFVAGAVTEVVGVDTTGAGCAASG